MAREEHLKVLKQGTAAWNAWRKQHPGIRPDLSRADLGGTNLSGVDLSGANLRNANLSRADLSGANLSGANLRNATLIDTNFSSAYLSGANLSSAFVWDTHFDNLDLRSVKGLENVTHKGPSHLSTSTLERSRGEIPEGFLRGVGMSDTFITYARSLVSQPIQYYTCFISYASKDQACAERLYADLQAKDVRCWFAPHDLRPGTYIHEGIDQAIRMYDKLVLLLSQHSVESNWVHFEVRQAEAKEVQRDQLVLFPIRIDDNVMTSTQPWAEKLRAARHIGDFTQWEIYQEYEKKFTDLLRHLQAQEKPPHTSV